jgi:hypothetical protein
MAILSASCSPSIFFRIFVNSFRNSSLFSSRPAIAPGNNQWYKNLGHKTAVRLTVFLRLGKSRQLLLQFPQEHISCSPSGVHSKLKGNLNGFRCSLLGEIKNWNCAPRWSVWTRHGKYVHTARYFSVGFRQRCKFLQEAKFWLPWNVVNVLGRVHRSLKLVKAVTLDHIAVWLERTREMRTRFANQLDDGFASFVVRIRENLVPIPGFGELEARMDNLDLRKCVQPSVFHNSQVVEIFRSNNESQLTNLRPVSGWLPRLFLPWAPSYNRWLSALGPPAGWRDPLAWNATCPTFRRFSQIK